MRILEEWLVSKNVKKIVIIILVLIMIVGLVSGFILFIKVSVVINNFMVKVEYVDVDGVEIVFLDILIDYYYVFILKDIFGYKLREIFYNVIGNIIDIGIIVCYIYDKIIDVSYVDEIGKDLLLVVEIIDSEVVILEIIFDYIFVRKDISIDGLYIIFCYKKNIFIILEFGKLN